MATKKCPIMDGPCIEHQCQWYIHLQGMNPQTAQPTDEWGCAVQWLPILLVENSLQQRQTAASVDKVAGEVNQHKRVFMAALNPEIQERILAALPKRPLLDGGNGDR